MRSTYRAAGPITAAAILTLLCGCSRAQQDWRAAQQAGTSQAYEVFVKRHPDSELAGIASQRIAQLTEQAAWQQATRANTPAAYQEYLAKYPNGSWSQDARIRMQSRSLATQAPQGEGPTTPRATPSVMAPGWPAPAAAPPAAQPAEPSANVERSAVQLGAFSSIANARTGWRQLSSKFGPELRGLTPQVIPVMSSGRRLYRLEARVASQAAARRLCSQLKQHSQGCLPVP